MSATLDRRRADGWRPSIYGCSKRRSNDKSCKNKYISDIILGPFIFNYVANIIRLRQSFTERMDNISLEKKLLKGDIFDDIKAIDPDSLTQLREVLLSGSTGIEYRPSADILASSDVSNERTTLLTQKRKHELAMSRLKSLYLYGNEQLPEKDYIIEQKRIMDMIDEIDNKLRTLGNDDTPLSDTSDVEKASYFIMVQQLLDEKCVNYEKYIRKIDPTIPRAFIRSIMSKISVTDGKIVSIEFRNGMTHKFIYNNESPEN